MKGIITIAGYGTRFLPASKALPKEMIPIVGIPLIQYHVESLVASGITDIIIVVRNGAEAVERHFAPDPALEQYLEATGKQTLLEEVRRLSRMANIVFVRQPETLPYGNASPALAARPWLTPGEPFYYMFGDDFFLSDVPVPKQLLQVYERYRPAAVLATQQVPDEETVLYGCIEFRPGTTNVLARIVEKPEPGTAPSNWVQVGHFVFTPEIFEVLDPRQTGKGGELWMADAVDRLAARATVIAQPIEGLWLAAGDPLHHLKASIQAALRQKGMREELVAYLRSLPLGE
ncbi:MAG: UTP--glucose-1-phosphate uridylyltransferase [Anaerolineae bacterium]|nr:UTP--glucose-1-phosphate uridylyltransferase [Anaerolineae bacterium]MDW8067832.1 UTP--glucose-1-phosphate uridylyltransferase [Anaerolineae bacterium]